MLKYSKLSAYKIKKIIDCFVADLTSSEASKVLKLNRHTTDKYYKIFRDIILNETYSLAKDNPDFRKCENCSGPVKSEYFHDVYYKLYLIKDKHIFPVRMSQRPFCNTNPFEDLRFVDAIRYGYKRLAKFHGFKADSHHMQIVESAFRHSRTKEELYEIVWKNLTKNINNNKLLMENYDCENYN